MDSSQTMAPNQTFGPLKWLGSPFWVPCQIPSVSQTNTQRFVAGNPAQRCTQKKSHVMSRWVFPSKCAQRTSRRLNGEPGSCAFRQARGGACRSAGARWPRAAGHAAGAGLGPGGGEGHRGGLWVFLSQ